MALREERQPAKHPLTTPSGQSAYDRERTFEMVANLPLLSGSNLPSVANTRSLAKKRNEQA
ncbi:hypothetical protein GCM10022280_09310 [Sphingomonas swuensis]|uniref:Transposase n=1 Tax=Sphingomonas swuensis TaxID=977800 RepID=A0ABP7SM62_9SPHN